MKRHTIAAVVAVCVLGLAAGVICVVGHHAAVAAEGAVTYTCTMHPQIKSTEPGKCPICGMDLVAVQVPVEEVCNCPWCRIARSTQSADEDEIAKRMRMSDPIMMRCKMMMRLTASPEDPAALLALKDELGLTEEQVGKLETILAEAREKAKAVLAAEQMKKLEGVADTPGSMMDMHNEIGRGRGRRRSR